MTDTGRILTDQESARLRSERAAHNGAPIITLCAEPGCPRAASHGPWCGEHRPLALRAEPNVAIAHDLDRDQIAAIRQQVEDDAAPLFVIAMSWIARQHVAQLGITPASFEASVTRIQAELEQGAPA